MCERNKIMINKLIFTIILFSIIGCNSNKNTVKDNEQHNTDTLKAEQAFPPPPPINVETAIKENSTIVGAVVDSLELLDPVNYRITVYLMTAIPNQNSENILEPGQTIIVYPAFIFNESNQIDFSNPINNKLIQLRTLKKKGYFIGNISLAADKKYYITSVEVFDNPPE